MALYFNWQYLCLLRIERFLLFSFFLGLLSPVVGQVKNYHPILSERVFPLQPHPEETLLASSEQIFFQQVLPELKKKSILIITNPSGIGRMPHTLRAELDKNKVQLKAFLTPEHGLLGLDETMGRKKVKNHSFFQVPVYNANFLKGRRLRKILQKVDAIVFDIQELGIRCFTYVTVLKRVMDVMTDKQPLIILDHIHPGVHLQPMGIAVSNKFRNYAGEMAGNFITGLTMAEYAYFYNEEYLRGTRNILLITVKNYQRHMLFDRTGIPWRSPSPNLPSIAAARNYYALALLEGVNVSLGRGTQLPFLVFGAPWIRNPEKMVKTLNAGAKEYYFEPVYFKPRYSMYKGKICRGLRLKILYADYHPIRLAYKMLTILRKYRGFRWRRFGKNYQIDYLWGSSSLRRAIMAGKTFQNFHNRYQKQEEKLKDVLQKYLLY